MALFNYATKEITLKLVYYGPGLCGKTTNLQHLHSTFEPDRRGKLLALSTETDRTLFFDFLPVKLGKIKDFSIRFQLYTVPGQVRYDSTRRLVLKGADAVIFVADSQKEMREPNIESLENMRENLRANNIDPDDIPVVLQYNKRDLPQILSVGDLNKDLNAKGYEYVLAEAINGKGVKETFQTATKLLIKDIAKRHKIEIESGPEAQFEEEPFASAPATGPMPAPQEAQEAPQAARFEEVEALPEPAGEEPPAIELFPLIEEEPAQAEPAPPQVEEAWLSELETTGGKEAEARVETFSLEEEEFKGGGKSPETEAIPEPVEEEEPFSSRPSPPKPSLEPALSAEEERISKEQFAKAFAAPEISLPETAQSPYMSEKIEIMFNSLLELQNTISKAVSEISKEVAAIKTDQKPKESKPPSEKAVSDMSKEIRELKKQQTEILKVLKEIVEFLSSIAEKKGLLGFLKR